MRGTLTFNKTKIEMDVLLLLLGKTHNKKTPNVITYVGPDTIRVLFSSYL